MHATYYNTPYTRPLSLSLHIYIYIYMCTCMYVCTHICTHKLYCHTCRTFVHRRMRTCRHADIQTYIHQYIRRQTGIHRQTYIHTQQREASAWLVTCHVSGAAKSVRATGHDIVHVSLTTSRSMHKYNACSYGFNMLPYMYTYTYIHKDTCMIYV